MVYLVDLASNNDEIKQAKKWLYYWLSRREYSQLELKRKFTEKQIPQSIYNAVLSDFIAQGYQSDERFAEMRLRSLSHKSYGIERVKAELASHKIDAITVEKVLAESDVDWLVVLLSLHEKKFQGLKPEDFKAKQKQIQFFRQKGFPFDLINQLWRAL